MLHTAASLFPGGGGMGGSSLRDLLQAMRTVTKSMSQLGGDISVASNSMKKWATGESTDVEDTLSISSMFLNHYSSILIQFAIHFDRVCGHLTDIASYERAISDLKRNHFEAAKKSESIEKKLRRMLNERERKDVQAEELAWNTAKQRVSQLSDQIRAEEINIVEFRRRSARVFIEVILGGLSEFSRKGMVISTYGSCVIQHVTEEPPNATHPYNSYYHTRKILTEAEAEDSLRDVAGSSKTVAKTTASTGVQVQNPPPTRHTTTESPATHSYHPFQSNTPYPGLLVIDEYDNTSPIVPPSNPQHQSQSIPITPILSETLACQLWAIQGVPPHIVPLLCRTFRLPVVGLTRIPPALMPPSPSIDPCPPISMAFIQVLRTPLQRTVLNRFRILPQLSPLLEVLSTVTLHRLPLLHPYLVPYPSHS
ncbi:hypothetical protein JAAARDRAFT_414854 [Jaapia argillacea MUCL 33604]|uniref:Uncharacterized protein n=1 Tax=Jaapia argillacea MUCL 33604 TaxID=933084 RepID=A0A067PG18_9AGAM|nr:hypothetical protein JAAARDRAFT_414854 [Jaapia argillacea MUCL 33604]